MKITLYLIPLTIAIIVWNQFIKKPDSAIAEFLNSIPFFKEQKDVVIKNLFTEIGKIIGIYLLINKFFK